MECTEGWIMINGMITKVVTWGTWIEDLQENQTLIFVICGNPGVCEFYRPFLQSLYQKLHIPIWIVSHAGHELPDNWLEKTILYNVEDQIDHKKSIIRKYVKKGCKLYLIGHSFGAKVALEMFKDADIEEKVIKAYMIFPTVERMADTSNGKTVKMYLQYATEIAFFFAWILTYLLPWPLKRFFVYIGFILFGHNVSMHTVDATIQFLQPVILKNAGYLANDELEKITQLDVHTLRKFKKKFKFYFGPNDQWSPKEYYESLKRNVDGIDATLCVNGIHHAFMMHSHELMAEIVSQWIIIDMQIIQTNTL